jgi:methionine-rich copper-binding protein CopC
MRRVVLPLLLAGFAVLGLALPASAHNVLVGSTPAKGASLATGPTEIRFDFNAPVRNGPNTIIVTSADGSHWERSQNATVDGNSVFTKVAPLGPAGVYTASYRIISADGHPVSGDITFTLTTAGTGTPVMSASMANMPGMPGMAAGGGSSGGGGGGVPVWVWIVGAVVVLGVGLTFALRGARGAGDGEDGSS